MVVAGAVHTLAMEDILHPLAATVVIVITAAASVIKANSA